MYNELQYQKSQKKVMKIWHKMSDKLSNWYQILSFIRNHSSGCTGWILDRPFLQSDFLPQST